MKTKVQGLLYDKSNKIYKIRELETSITSKCHLRCDNCGFYIPSQPNPAKTDNVITEMVSGLSYLKKLNIKIGSLAILGGEPAFNKMLLEAALKEFSRFDNIERIEVVSHGLVPQNITKLALSLIDKLTISVYFDNKELITLWKNYLDRFAPNIELSLRIDQNWDKWLGDEIADNKKAQKMFDYCWYRKHGVALERQRLFVCSRLAKLKYDEEGIVLNDQTTLEHIKNYLNKTSFVTACKNCIPMMGFPTIKAGQQPDNRISRMMPKAINFLKAELHEKS